MAFNSNQLLFKTEQLLEIIPWTERGLVPSNPRVY